MNTRNILHRKITIWMTTIVCFVIAGLRKHVFTCFLNVSLAVIVGVLFQFIGTIPHSPTAGSDDRSNARTTFGSSILMKIVIMACWVIWTTRNGVIFYNKTTNLQSWKANFKEELGMVCIKTEQKLRGALTLWREIFFLSFGFPLFLLAL